MVKLERDLMKQIEGRLGVYQLTGEVVWYMRTNAGKVKTYYGSYLNLAPKGTPDYIVIIRNKQGNLTLLFIEAKSDTGKLRHEQKVFNERYNSKKDTSVITLRDIRELDAFIEANSFDFVEGIGL